MNDENVDPKPGGPEDPAADKAAADKAHSQTRDARKKRGRALPKGKNAAETYGQDSCEARGERKDGAEEELNEKLSK